MPASTGALNQSFATSAISSRKQVAIRLSTRSACSFSSAIETGRGDPWGLVPPWVLRTTAPLSNVAADGDADLFHRQRPGRRRLVETLRNESGHRDLAGFQ